MVYAAACRALGVTPLFQPVLPPPPTPRIVLEAAGRDDEAALAEAVAQVYDIAADDRRMRASCAPDADAAARAKAFDHLRETYPLRREFHATTVVLRGASASLAAACAGLGFRVERG
jgi:erythronate-4-phosphate dehydrogenase